MRREFIRDDCWSSWNRTDDGRLTWNHTTFPSGIPALVDYVHAKGMKFVIYSARCAATCARRAASLGHYAEDAETFASWGVDFLKFDNCHGCPAGTDTTQQFREMHDALNQSGRHMVYSTELYDLTDSSTRSITHMTRVGGDIGGGGHFAFADIQREVNMMLPFSSLAGPGYFNDPDCLMVTQQPPTACRHHDTAEQHSHSSSNSPAARILCLM